MRKPIIVGASHEEILGMELLDEYAQKRFAKEISPLISKETLLLLEGDYRPKIYALGDKRYAEHHREAEYLLNVHIPGTPRLGWTDKRYVPSQYKELEKVSWIGERLAASLDRRRFRCRSLDELLREVKKVPPQPRFQLMSPKHQRVLARWHASVLQFDEPTLCVARKNSEKYQVIIVCGAGHALAIHRSTGWRLRLLVPDTEEEATETFVQYNIAYDVTR